MPTPDFILELRTKIGHDQLWLPGVTALVTDDAGRVLLGQRSDSSEWALPSGIAEPGEEMAAACVREVLEETEVVIEVDQLISIHTSPEIRYPNGDRTIYVDHYFRCRAVGGAAGVGDDESLAVGWFDPSDLPEPCRRDTPMMIARAAEIGERTWFAR